MKGSITTSQTFRYILLFTLLFTGFLALAITYNKVYKMKNEVISIIEKYEGISSNQKTLEIVNNYLESNGYNVTGQCDADEHGIIDLTNPVPEDASPGNRYFYCLSSEVHPGENGAKIYYDVKLFFKFNLPFIGELFTFQVAGESKGINYYDSSQELN